MSTVVDWLLPPLMEIVVGTPSVAEAVKVRGLPVRPALVAVRVLLLVPAVVPSFQEPTVAMPEALVVWEPPVSEPPPDATAKVTETPETGLPNWSVTSAEGAVATFVSTVVDWLLPPLIAIEFALSAITPIARAEELMLLAVSLTLTLAVSVR